MDRNSTNLGNNKYDWIELIYSNLDDFMAPTYRKIIELNRQLTDEREQINMALDIIIFVNFIRWRVPARDKIVYEVYDRYKIGDLGLNMINKETNEIIHNRKFEEFLKGLDVFRKSQSAAIIWEPWYNYEHINLLANEFD